MPILEISIFPSSDTLLADPDSIRSTLERFSKVDGCLSVHYGLGIDKPGQLAMIGREWESLKQCNAALSSDKHSAFLEGIKSAMSGTMKTLLVDCKVSPAVAFGAPITEAYCIKLKEAGELESYVKIASEAEKLLPSIDGIRVPVSWGVGIDAPDMIGAVVGWDTVQAYEQLPKMIPADTAAAQGHAMEELNIYHFQLKKVDV